MAPWGRFILAMNVDIGIFFTDRYLDIITAAPMVFDHGSFAIVSITNSRLIHHS